MSDDRSTLQQQPSDLDLAGVNTAEAMACIIRRERARVERRGGHLSLVFFDLRSADIAVTNLLAWAVLRRKRVTDELGWYGEGTVALLLPDTNSRNAKIVAEHICEMVRAPISYCIYRYPDEDSQESGDGPPSGDVSERSGETHCRGVFQLQPLLQPEVPGWKRTIDVLGSLFGLFLSSPLFLAIAAFIKVVSPGPVFYRQERVGKGGRRFQLLKFRSMKPEADEALHRSHLSGLLTSDVPMLKLDSRRDPRVIPLGNLLRWSCLDELPQLINVLRGEMSLVGPRPCLPYEADQYQLWQTRRFDVLPGITGLWQVSGKNRLTFRQMVRLDIRYGLYPSLGQDIRIMLRTIPTMIGLLIEASTARAAVQASSTAPVGHRRQTQVSQGAPELLQQQ